MNIAQRVMFLLFPILLAVFMLTGTSHQQAWGADPLDTWLLRSYYPSGQFDLLSIASDNNGFVAVGSGNIQTSTTGSTWRQQTKLVTLLNSTAFGGGMYVAVGPSGAIHTSTDGGVNWTRQLSGTTETLRSVGWCNGKFIAVGDNGTIVTSSDGSVWSVHSTGTVHSLRSVAYGNGIFTAVGFREAGVVPAGCTFTSSDGESWTVGSEQILLMPLSLAFGNGKFVAVGQIRGDITSQAFTMTSTDGINWNSQGFGISYWTFTGVTYANDLFVAVGNQGAIYSSADGITWAAHAGTPGPFNGIAFGNGTFVVISGGGLILQSGTMPFPKLFINPTSVAFPSAPVGSSGTPQSITIGNNGTSSLSIAAISLAGADADQFTLYPGSCLGSLTPGGTCAVSVSFNPTTSGRKSAALRISSNDAVSLDQVLLTGIDDGTVPLDTTITSFPPDPSGSTTFSFDFKASVTNCTFKCTMGGSPWQTCTSPYTGGFYCLQCFGCPCKGTQTFFVRAKDPLGNYDPTPASYTWTFDHNYNPIDNANDGDIIYVPTAGYMGDIVVNRFMSFVLRGGSDLNGTFVGGISPVSGSITITNGTVTIDGISIS